MNHDQWEELIFQFYDGELKGAEEAQARRHLDECPSCAGALNEWKKLVPKFFKSPPIQSTDAFTRRVMAVIDEKAGAVSQPGFFGWKWPTLAMAFGTLLLIASFPSAKSTPTVARILIASTNGASLDGFAEEEHDADDFLTAYLEARK